MSLTDCATQIQGLLHHDPPGGLIFAATGAGKSKFLPSALVRMLRENPELFAGHKLLVFTTSSVDVEDMNARAIEPSCFRYGEQEGGSSWVEANIVFVTSGLGARWYASSGIDLYAPFSCVLFDEIGDAERHCDYALLYEAAVKVREQRHFPIVLASSVPGPCLTDLAAKENIPVVRCPLRPYELQHFVIELADGADLVEAVVNNAHMLYAEGHTSLCILPGKGEIKQAEDSLLQKGLVKAAIDWLHAELEPQEVASAKQPKGHVRILLSTSFAGQAATIPDIDYVLDAGLSRTTYDDAAICAVEDRPETESDYTNRAGRAGRVKPGVAVRFKITGTKLPVACPVDVEKLQWVMAVEPREPHIPPSSCRLCSVPSADETLARQGLTTLAINPGELFTAAQSVPLPLTDAMILLRAMELGVGFEASALLSLKSTGACKKYVTAMGAVQVVTDGHGTPPGFRKMPLQKARKKFRLLRDRFELAKNHDDVERKVEALATSFLLREETLLWVVEKSCAHTGRQVSLDLPDGYYVGVAGHRFGNAVSFSVVLPCTQRAATDAGVRLPTFTAGFVGDSTFTGHMNQLCKRLRRLGYDLRYAHVTPGEWESDMPTSIMAMPFVELCIVCPNGNRLSKQCRTEDQPLWLEACVREIVGALERRAEYAVTFVGDAVFSPGAHHPEAYKTWVPVFQEMLRSLGLPVVCQIPAGVEITADGIHWDPTAEISELVTSFVENAKVTELFTRCPCPPLWHWEYNETHGMSYPTCKQCGKRATPEHLAGQFHRGVAEGFEFPGAWVEQGKVFIGRDGSIEKRPLSPAAATSLEKEAGQREVAQNAAQEAAQTVWREVRDLNGRVYFWNILTGLTQWEHPCVQQHLLKCI